MTKPNDTLPDFDKLRVLGKPRGLSDAGTYELLEDEAKYETIRFGTLGFRVLRGMIEDPSPARVRTSSTL